MDIEEIKKEYIKYCEDNNYCCDKSDFIYDYIKYNYDLGKISLSDMERIIQELEKII